MKLKIASVLATGVTGAIAGFALGFASAGSGGWLGPMPLVAAMFISTYLAILGLIVGAALSFVSSKSLTYLILAGALASLIANIVLAFLLGGGLELSLAALAQGALIGAAFAGVYKLACNWLSTLE